MSSPGPPVAAPANQHHPTKKGKKKATKGHAPAHQNETAWRHNPKSKKTAKILASPITGVCRRCRQKLEWRKKYRKYKPRTVAGTCNLCLNKNAVRAAYHTVCDHCSRNHETARARLREWALSSSAAAAHDSSNDTTDGRDEKSRTSSYPQQICCICVKEPSLEGISGGLNLTGSGKDDGGDGADRRPMRLRQRKTLERQSTNPRRPRAVKSTGDESGSDDEEEDADDDEDDSCGGVDDDDDDADDGVDDDARPDKEADDKANAERRSGVGDDRDDDDDGQDDPLLRAVGGRANLLVGDAYRQRLLELHLRDDDKCQRPRDD